MSLGPWELEVWTPSQSPTASPHHVWALTPPGFPAHHVPSTLVLRHQTALSPKASAQASHLGLGMGVGGRCLQLPCGLKVAPCLHRTFSGFPRQARAPHHQGFCKYLSSTLAPPAGTPAESCYLPQNTGNPAHFLSQHSSDVFSETSLWSIDHPITLTLTRDPKIFS